MQYSYSDLQIQILWLKIKVKIAPLARLLILYIHTYIIFSWLTEFNVLKIL